MGGIEDKTHSPGSVPAKTLILQGIVIMGGVTIKNVSRRVNASLACIRSSPVQDVSRGNITMWVPPGVLLAALLALQGVLSWRLASATAIPLAIV